MGKQIVEDGEDLKAIEENIDDAHVQVVAAEKEITQANKYQKKSTRKYWIFAFIILVALGVIFALVFTWVQATNKQWDKQSAKHTKLYFIKDCLSTCECCFSSVLKFVKFISRYL